MVLRKRAKPALLILPLQLSQVEMFVLCTPEQSDAMHQELVDLEKSMYSQLGLHFKVRRFSLFRRFRCMEALLCHRLRRVQRAHERRAGSVLWARGTVAFRGRMPAVSAGAVSEGSAPACAG